MFYAGAGQSFAESVGKEQARQRQFGDVMAQMALQGYLDPSTAPEVREQYRQFLRGTPYEAFTSINISETPSARLQRELGPLLSGAQAVGALGNVGMLTPEIGAQIEGIVGQEFLPRKTVTMPGLPVEKTIEGIPVPRAEEGGLSRFLQPAATTTMKVTEPGKPVTTRVIDVGRFKQPTVKLFTGDEVPVEALKGLSGDLQMYLLQGPQGRPAQTYGQLFGEGLKPEWRNLPVQFDSNGSLKFPPSHAFVDKPSPGEAINEQKFETQQQAAAEYARVLRATGSVDRAWRAASAIDPVTFKPDLATPSQQIDLENRQRRIKALEAFNQAVKGGKPQQDAYNAAFAIDPTFPAPATMDRPGGAQDVTLNQVEKAANDLRAEIAGLQELARAGGDPDEMLLVGNQYVFRKDLQGVITQKQAELSARERQLADLRGKGPAKPPLPPAPEWATGQIAEMKKRGVKSRKEAMALFRKVRARDQGNKVFGLDYWRALYEAIQREFP